MKRWVAAVLAVFALTALGGSFAKRIELEGADMSAVIPEGWLWMTRKEAAQENAAQFGMTADEAAQFMKENDFYLVLYEPQSGAEIYVTVFGSPYAQQLGALEDLTQEEMAQAKEVVLTGYPDWIMDGEIVERQIGGRTYLEAQMHMDQEGTQLNNRQLFTVNEGIEIYVDLYVSENEPTQEQKAVQDDLTESLRMELSVKRIKSAYYGYVAARIALMAAMLIQFAGVAMTILLRIREKTV